MRIQERGRDIHTHTHATVAGRGVTQKSPMVTEKKTSKLFVHFSHLEIRGKKKRSYIHSKLVLESTAVIRTALK